ncbi:hypothetical protein NGK36_21560 [Hafnia alvei]|uniref:hypothetical protein n=1 Tax=Hafnia alvei TaxID=569 RepID=UPI002DBB4B59|nr:hypothetical protein [Hafnia alvei]MEB7891849.1 hypothetical protein [Hafnia alvei]
MGNSILDTLRNSKDTALDTWDQVTSDQTSRAGHAMKRVASQLASGVDPEVTALQATKNSEKNNPDDPQVFSGDDMVAVAKFYVANRTRTVMTRAQTNAINKEQNLANAEGSSTNDGAEPQTN